MRKERAVKLSEQYGSPVRHPDRIITVRVPCGMSPGGRARHPVRVVLSQDGTILHLSAACDADDQAEILAAAERLEADTCRRVVHDFLKTATNASASFNSYRREGVPNRIVRDSVLLALCEQAHTACSVNRATDEPDVSARGAYDGRGRPKKRRQRLHTLTDKGRATRAAHVLNEYITRHVVFGAPHEITKYGEAPFRVARSSRTERRDDGTRTERQELHLEVSCPNGHGYRRIGTITPTHAAGVCFYKLDVDFAAVREASKHALINRGAYCLCCKREYSGSGNRHAESPKHRTRLGAMVRQIVKLFAYREQVVRRRGPVLV